MPMIQIGNVLGFLGGSFIADVRSGCCRKDTYENTWLYYVELVIKGNHKLLGSKKFFL